jgi:Methane oxygenase PmoA
MHYHNSIQIKFLFLLRCGLMFIPTGVWCQHFTTIKSNEGIEILENGKKVLFYQVRPKSVDGKYERAGYVHPLYSLNEKILTDDMPEDHPYHRGIFWAWHQIILNDRNIADGWISENISWKPVKVKTKKNKDRVVLESQMLWTAALDTHNPKAIVKEETKITVNKSTSQYRILDFDIHLFALVDNLKIGGSDDEKGYGGFCLRLKLPKDLLFVSENKIITPQDTQVLAGPWMDFTGSFEGENLPKTGVVVFGYLPGSIHLHPWILRNVTSMQNISFPGRTPIALSKKGLSLSYRIIVHNGVMGNEEIEKLYREWRSSIVRREW